MGRSKQPASEFASKFFCSIPECGETFTKMANLQRHTKTVHEKTAEFKYRCGKCATVFRKQKQLYNHNFLVHNEERQQKYSCEHCPAKFVLPSKLKAHMKRHNGYQCSDCEFRSDTWSALRRHKADVHPTLHKCDQCEKTFLSPFRLKKHQRVHEKMVKCPSADCNEKILPRNLASHIKTAHADKLPDGRQLNRLDDVIDTALGDDVHSTRHYFECAECGKTFAKARNLRLHKRNVHEKETEEKRPPSRTPSFACTVENCTRRFTCESKLKYHLNSHLGIQPYQCPQNGCTARFAGRHALQKHVKHKHMMPLKAYEVADQLAEVNCVGESTDGEE